MEQELKNDTNDKMNKALTVLERDLQGLRTGRSSISMLEPVLVEAYGDRMPLSQIGTISAPDAKSLSVQVWDKDLVKKAEKAIADSNLGLTPMADGQLLRMNIPPLSEDRRKEIVKLAHKYGENCKISVRNIRRDTMETLKKMEKASAISEDDLRAQSDEVQKITDDFIKKVEGMATSKEKDIMTI